MKQSGIKLFILGGILVLTATGFDNLLAQKKNIPADLCLNAKEQLLAKRINLLRVEYEKKTIPLSISLTYVAKTHIEDLSLHHPDTSICNLSSWSDKGNWTPCCYNPYVVKHECMWEKPKELTHYQYRGYELIGYFQNKVSIDSLTTLWFDSQEVLDMILTRGIWSEKNWKTMGVAVNDHYASLWFGQRPDKQGAPAFCKGNKHQITIINKNTAPITSAYYLIFGSYNRMKEAKIAVKKYKKEGYKQANVLVKNNHYRLYLSKYETLKEAMAAKQLLPPTLKKAWILKH